MYFALSIIIVIGSHSYSALEISLVQLRNWVFSLILINLFLNSHMGVMALLLGSAAPRVSGSFFLMTHAWLVLDLSFFAGSSIRF